MFSSFCRRSVLGGVNHVNFMDSFLLFPIFPDLDVGSGPPVKGFLIYLGEQVYRYSSIVGNP